MKTQPDLYGAASGKRGALQALGQPMPPEPPSLKPKMPFLAIDDLVRAAQCLLGVHAFI